MSIEQATLTDAEMRRAVQTRDRSYDGLFFYGVVTTGVYCKPSCASRAAKPENLRFFETATSAVLDGFRPCLRCQKHSSDQTTNVIRVARYIEEHASEKLSLIQLAKLARLSPSQFHRVFKASLGVSPKEYQSSFRLRQLKGALKEGLPVTDSIYAAGFGSTSRVYGQERRSLGMSPKQYRRGGADEQINYAVRDTCMGPLLMAASQKGVCFAQFGDNSSELIAELEREFPKAELVSSPNEQAPELDAWIDALNQHLAERTPCPDLPLDMRGTAFQIRVWEFLLSIREGEVLSYTQVAERIDKPRAVRAVASACAKNRIGVLVPCHRVLRSDGGIGGYRWGLERKQQLLQDEKKQS